MQQRKNAIRQVKGYENIMACHEYNVCMYVCMYVFLF